MRRCPADGGIGAGGAGFPGEVVTLRRTTLIMAQHRTCVPSLQGAIGHWRGPGLPSQPPLRPEGHPDYYAFIIIDYMITGFNMYFEEV